MSRNPVIEFKDFSFRYKSQSEQTLKNINLTIYEGEKVLLLGPSGCGKSTLASCINGLIPFSYPGEITGTCKVAGVETTTSSIFKLSSYVGTVLQDSDAQFVGLSVGEDIAYALENDNMPRSEMLPRVESVANLVHMQDFLGYVPYKLSGGQKQRVSLAGIMHDDVKILLFDEPLAALDPKMGNQAIELIDEIQSKSNKTVVIIEHRLEDVLHRKVDRIILMSDGQIVEDTTPDKLLCSKLLVEKGIREPLYLSAIRMAGCEIKEEDKPSDIYAMNLEPYKEKVINYFKKVDTTTTENKEDVIINVENVSYKYGPKYKNSLTDISFKIRKKEKVALIGENGAGKSTLAKLICGIIRPDEGHVEINGTNYLEMTIKEINTIIGYVMQNPNQMLVKDFIKDEVSLGFTLNNIPSEIAEERIEEILKMTDLWSMRSWPVGVLSYGQKKRVTIASILAMKPDVIILDEPTAGQDYRIYTEIMSFLNELNQKYGITIIFITHDMHLAIEYTDRAIVLADSKCIGDDSVFKILSNNDIIEQASLKQTSLYILANRLGIDPERFIDSFIQAERNSRHES